MFGFLGVWVLWCLGVWFFGFWGFRFFGFLGEFSVGWVMVFCFRFFFESGFVVFGFYGLGFWVKVLG